MGKRCIISVDINGKEMHKAKTKRQIHRPRSGAHLLLRVALVLFIAACTIAFISTQNAIIEKKQEIAELKESIESVTAQNEELAALIKSDDIGRYMEKLAVENNDYAYPDERRYYDTSHN